MRTWIFHLDDEVKINENAATGLLFDVGKVGTVHERLTTGSYDYIVRLCDGSKVAVREHELDRVKKESDSVEGKEGHRPQGKYEKISIELGQFTDDKNKQYGSSVDATYEMMKVLMNRYTYDEERYLIPKSLVKHMLLQVRMMDKINRIFNNPDGKDEKESPYRDLGGYSLIGVDMVESNKPK